MTDERFFSDACFCCGRDNPRGMHLKIEKTADGVQLPCIIDPCYQSFTGVVHGGIVSTLIDEVLWYAFYARGIVTVTRKLEITYKRPVPVGKPIIASAKVGSLIHHKIWEVEGRISDGSGSVLVLARGEFVETEALREHLRIFTERS